MWNIDFTLADVLRRRGMDDVSYLNIHRRLVETTLKAETSEHEYATIESRIFGDYLFTKLGRPRWFIDAEMLSFLANTTVDGDPNEVFLPYDCFSLVFHTGATLSGRPLRWIRVYRPRSTLASQILNDHMNEVRRSMNYSKETSPTAFEQSSCRLFVDDGLKYDGTYEQATTLEEASVSSFTFGRDRNKDDDDFAALRKIVAAAVMFYAARPELFIEYTLPRSERFKQLGDRATVRRLMFPTVKRVHTSNEESSGTAFVSPHVRGWVLRTLRDNRYQRDKNGKPRVILVEPCIIHKELLNLPQQ